MDSPLSHCFVPMGHHFFLEAACVLVASSACSPAGSVDSGLVSAGYPSEASRQVKSCAKTSPVRPQ